MSGEELWAVFVAKNPHFADGQADCRLTGNGLKKLFDQTFSQGMNHGRETFRFAKNDRVNEMFKEVTRDFNFLRPHE